MRNQYQMYGSFLIGDQEFAISIEHLNEVVEIKQRLTPLPLSPPHLLGLFNLRNSIVPVLNLNGLLNIGPNLEPENQKVAIVECDGSRVGLLIETTDRIFFENQFEMSSFSNSTEKDSKEVRQLILGVFKDTLRGALIQVLDIPKIFSLGGIPFELSDRKNSSTERRKGEVKQKCISFSVGTSDLALPIQKVEEILDVTEPMPSALGIGSCLGILNLRGSILPLVDLKFIISNEESQIILGSSQKILVLKIQNEPIGFLVDKVNNLISYERESLLPIPKLGSKSSEIFLGCITETTEHLLLMNPEYLLSSIEVLEITRGHSLIYRDINSQKQGSKFKRSRVQTLITFRQDDLFAIPIQDVVEILELPKDLLVPPAQTQKVAGLFNLRGKMVTVMNTGKDQNHFLHDQTSPPPIIIIKKQDELFGVVVDSVESIVQISAEDKIRLPELLFRTTKGTLISALTEAVEVPDVEGKKHQLLILSKESLLNNFLDFENPSLAS